MAAATLDPRADHATDAKAGALPAAGHAVTDWSGAVGIVVPSSGNPRIAGYRRAWTDALLYEERWL